MPLLLLRRKSKFTNNTFARNGSEQLVFSVRRLQHELLQDTLFYAGTVCGISFVVGLRVCFRWIQMENRSVTFNQLIMLHLSH